MSKIIDDPYSSFPDEISRNKSIDAIMSELNNWNPHDHDILKGHGGAVWAITSTSDNAYIFSGSEDKLVIVWDGKQNSKLKELQGHSGTINVLDITRDNKTLISGCWGNQIKLWDWMNGQLTGELIGHTAGVYCSLLLKTSDILVTGAGDYFARVWDLNSKTLIASCDCAGNSVFAIAMTKDEKTLFAGGWDGNIRTWDFTTKTLQSTYEGKSGVIQSMAMPPDSRFLIFGTRNNIIKVLNWPGLTDHSTYTCHNNWVRNLVCTNDSTYFISASADRSVRMFNIEDKTEEFNFDKNDGYVFGLHLSKDGTLLYSGASDKFVRKRVIGIKNNVKVLRGHQKTIMSLAISSDSKYIVSGSEDKNLIVWDVEREEVKFTLTGHTETIWGVAISNDMKCIASGSGDKTVKMWDFAGNLVATLTGHSNPIFTVAINNASTLIATGAQDKLVGVFDIQNKGLVKLLEGHTDTIFSVKFNFNGDLILSGAADYTIRIWSVKNLILVEKIDTKSGMIESLSLTKDSKYLIIGDRATFVHLWDWEERKSIKKFTYHTKWVKCVALSYDDKFFASCSNDCTIQMYNLTEKRKELHFMGHTSTIRSLAFSNDQSFLASGSEDYTVRIWDTQDQTVLKISDVRNIYESFLFMNCLYNKVEPHEKYCSQSLSPLRINLAHIYSYRGNHELLKIALENGASIKIDTLMNSPLHYALDRNSQNCIDVILNYMNDLKENNQALFLDYAWSIRDDFKKLLKNRSIYLPSFLDNLLILSSQTDLPKFGRPLHLLPHPEYSESTKIDKELFLRSAISNSQEKIIEFKLLPFKIDMISGSRGSLLQLNSIYKCPNRLIYRSDIIQILVKSKWNTFWYFILILTGLNWLNIGLMIALLVQDDTNVTLIIIYGIVNIILFLYEVVQALSVGVQDYMNFWNAIDICRSGVCLAWILIVIYLESRTSDTYNYLSYLMVIFNFLRGLSGFRAFDSTRFYVRLISRATREAMPFILIFFYTTLSFGMLNWASGQQYRIDSFQGIWKVPFELNMGNFNNSNIFDRNFTFFMFTSVINVIIILNLLISILGDSYDKFQAEAIQIGTLEQIELIIEIETIMFWRRRKGQMKYILICDETKFEGITEEWEGKLKAISDMINKNHKSTKKSLDHIMKKIEAIDKKLNQK